MVVGRRCRWPTACTGRSPRGDRPAGRRRRVRDRIAQVPARTHLARAGGRAAGRLRRLSGPSRLATRLPWSRTTNGPSRSASPSLHSLAILTRAEHGPLGDAGPAPIVPTRPSGAPSRGRGHSWRLSTHGTRTDRTAVMRSVPNRPAVAPNCLSYARPAPHSAGAAAPGGSRRTERARTARQSRGSCQMGRTRGPIGTTKRLQMPTSRGPARACAARSAVRKTPLRRVERRAGVRVDVEQGRVGERRAVAGGGGDHRRVVAAVGQRGGVHDEAVRGRGVGQRRP